MFVLPCKNCEKMKYQVVGIKLITIKGVLNDNVYLQINRCMQCDYETTHQMKFKSKDNLYRYIHLPSKGYINQFHRHIMELVLDRQLGSNERVIFINGNRGDARPSNLKVVRQKRRFIKI